MDVGGDQKYTAFFPDHASAQSAVADLEAAGISSSDLQLHNQSSGGSFMDSIKRFFSGDTYDESYGSGTLLTLYGNRSMALPILQRYGGRLSTDASYAGASGGAIDDTYATRGTTGDTYATRGAVDDTYATRGSVAGDVDQTMKLREERLSVDKQAVKAGEVRLGKEVVTEQQNIDVPVSHEEVYVSRRPVAEGEYAGNVGEIGDQREISVPVMREEVSVDKRAVVTEEVGLGKRTVQETQTVGGTVRKERATLETDGDIDDRITDTTR